MARGKMIQRNFLISAKENETLKKNAEKAKMNVNSYIRKVLSKNLPVSISQKDIDTIKRYLNRQHCLYCREFGLTTIDSYFEKEVVQCQTCQRKMLYLPRQGYYDLVPYDFFEQLQLPDPTEEKSLYQQKQKYQDIKEIQKVLLEEEKVKEERKFFSCNKCEYKSYFPADFFTSIYFEGYRCSECVEKEEEKDADNKDA